MTTLSEWHAEAKSIAAAFRLGACMQAGDPMAVFIRQVAQAYAGVPSASREELSRILEALLACHKSNDWLGVADYLEFELIDWLRRVVPEAGQ
jgi:hypothetical protein